MISKHAKEVVNSWLNNLQDGNKITVSCGVIYLHNSCGCLLDQVGVHETD